MMPQVICLPAGPIVNQVLVPGFTTGHPNIRYQERIPSDILEVMLNRWELVHDSKVISFYSLRNVYIVGEGLVFTEDGSLYAESITQNEPEHVAEAFGWLKTGQAENTIPRMAGVSLLCGKRGMFNYGHWMLEILPMAYLSRKWINMGWKVFLPIIYPSMANVIFDSLAGIGIDRECCITNDGKPVFFEEIVFVTGLSQVGVYYLPTAIESMQELGAGQPMGTAEKIWISRLDPSGGHRSLIAEAEVCRNLESNGWTILQPLEMTLAEQISAAKGATHMAGVAGAGLTSAGFMKPGARLTCFMPEAMPDVFFFHLATHLGLDYRELRYPIEMQPGQSCRWHGKLLTDFDEVLAQLQ